MENEILARLARGNINIISVGAGDGYVYYTYEYQWRKKDGSPKWSKSTLRVKKDCQPDKAFEYILDDVRELRANLED